MRVIETIAIMFISSQFLTTINAAASDSPSIFEQIDHSNLWDELKGLHAVGFYPSFEYAEQRLSNADFRKIFGIDKSVITKLPTEKKQIISDRAFDRIINGSLSPTEAYIEYLTYDFEPYLVFIDNHRNAEWKKRYGGAGRELTFQILKQSKWPIWDELFGPDADYDTQLNVFEAGLNSQQQQYKENLNTELLALNNINATIMHWVNTDPRDSVRKRVAYLQRSGAYIFDTEPALFLQSPMRFKISKSEWGEIQRKTEAIELGIETAWISAEGEITNDTPAEFLTFLKRHCQALEQCDLSSLLGVRTIAFHSQGGNLAAGMALGEIIRSIGLDTAISATESVGDYHRPTRGRCFSACAYAFLGGLRRRYEFYFEDDYARPNRDETFGLHRYSRGGKALFDKIGMLERAPLPNGTSEKCKSEAELQLAQCMDAQLIDYLNRMGVDGGRLFSFAATSDKIKYLSKVRARSLNVLTDTQLAGWSATRYGTGFAAVADGSDRDSKISRISTYCLKAGMGFKNYLEITHNPDERFSNDVNAPWAVSVNRNTTAIGPNKVRYWDNRVALELPTVFWESLISEGDAVITAAPIGNAGDENKWPSATARVTKHEGKIHHWVLKSCN